MIRTLAIRLPATNGLPPGKPELSGLSNLIQRLLALCYLAQSIRTRSRFMPISSSAATGHPSRNALANFITLARPASTCKRSRLSILQVTRTFKKSARFAIQMGSRCTLIDRRAREGLRKFKIHLRPKTEGTCCVAKSVTRNSSKPGWRPNLLSRWRKATWRTSSAGNAPNVSSVVCARPQSHVARIDRRAPGRLGSVKAYGPRSRRLIDLAPWDQPPKICNNARQLRYSHRR